MAYKITIDHYNYRQFISSTLVTPNREKSPIPFNPFNSFNPREHHEAAHCSPFGTVTSNRSKRENNRVGDRMSGKTKARAGQRDKRGSLCSPGMNTMKARVNDGVWHDRGTMKHAKNRPRSTGQPNRVPNRLIYRPIRLYNILTSNWVVFPQFLSCTTTNSRKAFSFNSTWHLLISS